MQLRQLKLTNFRAHPGTHIGLSAGINLVHGANGSGKTNLLEAIHYLCLTKSFLTPSDQFVLRKGSPFMEIEGDFETTRRSSIRVRLVYSPSDGKRAFVNGAPLDRLSDLVGRLPLVLFTPEDYILTAGGPEERRRFINNILSQSRPSYLEDVMKYRRAVRQRNEVLAARRKPAGAEAIVLESWTEELIRLGARIVARRLAFVEEFSEYMAAAYARIESVAERPTMRYASLEGLKGEMDEEAIGTLFRSELERSSSREWAQGRTLSGPHRDELIFKLNQMNVRRYASQGQHRTFAMALKLAQYFYLGERLGERPLFLLDDVFGGLDRTRTNAFLSLLQGGELGQSLITDTDLDRFESVVDFGEPSNQSLRVVAGAVEPEHTDV
jgi:DNA replication and repair protein RecF